MAKKREQMVGTPNSILSPSQAGQGVAGDGVNLGPEEIPLGSIWETPLGSSPLPLPDHLGLSAQRLARQHLKAPDV